MIASKQRYTLTTGHSVLIETTGCFETRRHIRCHTIAVMIKDRQGGIVHVGEFDAFQHFYSRRTCELLPEEFAVLKRYILYLCDIEEYACNLDFRYEDVLHCIQSFAHALETHFP